MSGKRIAPILRYADAAKAIEWLCDAFGFERQLVVPGENGTITHAQLRLGDGLIMLSSARAEEEGGIVVALPHAVGHVTQMLYVVVPEIEAHCEHARSRGAEIVGGISDPAHGGRLYSALDLEGHVWHFGSYDPWEPPE